VGVGPPRHRSDARRHRLARPEILGVQAVTDDPPAGKAVDETAHKRGRTADVEVRIARGAHFLEHLRAHAPHPVEIAIGRDRLKLREASAYFVEDERGSTNRFEIA
jgi:hypothetical protein